MKILFATSHLPSLQGGQAGAKTSYAICEFLSRTEEVHLLAFGTESEIESLQEQEMRIFASWQYIPVTKASRILGVLRKPWVPLIVATRIKSSYRRKLDQMLRAHDFDVVIFDHTGMLQYVQDIPETVVTVASLHDILTQVWERRAAHAKNALARIAFNVERYRTRRWEQRAFVSTDIIFPLSYKDRRLIENMVELNGSLMVIQPWIDPAALNKSGKRNPKQDSLLFWGAMDRVENVDAARWIADVILPRIREQIPTAHLYIAGSKSNNLSQIFGQREDVSLLGFIDDIEEMMGSMEIALLPLRLGAGIKVKTLECMAAAMPVVTTDVGAEGIDAQNGRDFLIANDAESIANKVILLLRNKSNAQKMGESGRLFIREMYNFEEKIEVIRERMLRLTAQKKSIGQYFSTGSLL